MSEIKATEVFTPGSFPSRTYIQRSARGYEGRLRDALDTLGQVVSLSGPSKSGKTVLVEQVVGRDNLIAITGAGISSADDVWARILDWMDVPFEAVRSRSTNLGASVGGALEGEGHLIPLIAKGKISGKGEIVAGRSNSAMVTHKRRGLSQVVSEIGNSEFVVLIDDFHYMQRNVQTEVAKQLKEAVRQNVKLVVASVEHRSDDMVRALSELRGRVMSIDLEYWETTYLSQIATRGFNILGVQIDELTLKAFVNEAAGSPQLMRAICLNACFELELRNQSPGRGMITATDEERRRIFERTAASTDFRSLVDVLDSGPKTRGTERKTYRFKDDTEGDVYRCILKAIAWDPPRLSFSYDEIVRRVKQICTGEEPVGSSITGSCLHMSKLAEEKFPQERVIDWDEQKTVFDIPDPYLLFYLRWSGRLLEAEG